jgi:hypothetical protein
MLYLEYGPKADTQEPTASCTHNNTQHTTKNIKNGHHGPPKLPASSVSNFTGECNWLMSRDQSQSLQHGDVTFIDKTNCSVILFNIILQAAAWRTCGQKVSFICWRNAASALLLSQSPFIEIYLNLTSTSTGESTPPVHHGLISCQSVLLYLLSTFEQ